MTVVKAPFVFLSDDYSAGAHPGWPDPNKVTDHLIGLSKLAGCRSVALQLTDTLQGQAQKWKAAGFQIIGWDDVKDMSPSVVEEQLKWLGCDVFMPQGERGEETSGMFDCFEAGIHKRFPSEPVMSSGGFDPVPMRTTDQTKRVFRNYGINTVWVEVYAQDANPQHPNLGDVEHMRWHFRNNYGFPEAFPVIGLWHFVPVSKYDISKVGRNFGAWRANQMHRGQYEEIATVKDVPEEKPPIPSLPDKITSQDGITGFETWLAKQSGMPQRGPKYDPNNLSTWPWPDKLIRTLRKVREDHDNRR